MRLAQILSGALLFGSILPLSGCVTKLSKEGAEIGGKAMVPVMESAARAKRTKPHAPAATPAPREADPEHGIRIIFRRDTEVTSGGKISYTMGGQTYSEDLPPLASARMCAIRLHVLCSRNGLKTEFDPPHAVKIFETEVKVRTTNVAFGMEKF